MDLTPFKQDIDELLGEFVKWNYMTLSDMKRVWMEKKFSFIYEARPSSNSAFFMQSLYAHSLSYIVSSGPLSQRLGGLYCLYCLYETQPYKPCFKIYLSLGELESLRSLVVEAKDNGIAVVPALVQRMLYKNMFLFGFVDIVGGFLAQRVDELTKQQNKASQTAYENLFRGVNIEHHLHMDLGLELDLPAIKKMLIEYDEAKELAIKEAGSKVNLEDMKHITESTRSLDDTLNDVVARWDVQKDAFYRQTGTGHPDQMVVSDDFAELERLLED